MERYSVKNTKDLVNSQIQKYKKIIDDLQDSKKPDVGNKPFISREQKESMNDELTEFIMNEIN
jgi:hypothetical protein